MTPEEDPDAAWLDPTDDGEYGEWDDDTEALEADDLPDYDRDAT